MTTVTEAQAMIVEARTMIKSKAARKLLREAHGLLDVVAIQVAPTTPSKFGTLKACESCILHECSKCAHTSKAPYVARKTAGFEIGPRLLAAKLAAKASGKVTVA